MTALLSEDDLIDLWETYADALTETCQLKAPVETGSGQTVKTWPAVTSTVACALLDGIGNPGSSQDYANSDLPNSRTVMLARGTTVAVGWRIVPTSGIWDDATFDVLSAQHAGTNGPAVQCDCVEVQP